MKVFEVVVDEVGKGAIWMENGRWRWQRVTRGIDTFPSGTTKEDIARFIARLVRKDNLNDIQFREMPNSESDQSLPGPK